MYLLNRLSKIFDNSEEVLFDDYSRFVLMSDCHRGDGTWADNFSKNQNFYFAALTYYYKNKYTYIEIGDGDELWENKDFSEIFNMHKDVFRLLSRFHKNNRLYFIYGNHDIVKRDQKFLEENLYKYYDSRRKKYIPLFEGLKVHEGLVLKHRKRNNKILLIHGHQVDFMNYTLWPISRFLVKNVWKPLETFGVKDPTSPAKNHQKKDSIDNKLTEWVERENVMIVAGHTHRSMFPEVGETPYFNDGSCVHPRCITAIEIEFGYIRLVKWHMKTNRNGLLYIGRDTLAGP
ncbi:MAG: metallophosphoesterase family protein, partial [Clostridia bacterium]|nr:metallophosphoesterase family protein [Clostridia bacterium]